MQRFEDIREKPYFWPKFDLLTPLVPKQDFSQT